MLFNQNPNQDWLFKKKLTTTTTTGLTVLYNQPYVNSTARSYVGSGNRVWWNGICYGRRERHLCFLSYGLGTYGVPRFFNGLMLILVVQCVDFGLVDAAISNTGENTCRQRFHWAHLLQTTYDMQNVLFQDSG